MGALLIGFTFNQIMLNFAIPMIIGDLTQLWIVSLETPFLFFDSPFLENVLLWPIMLLDIGFDFFFFAIWFFVSAVNFNESIWAWFFTFLAVCSGIIFGFDIYQVYLFFYRYRVEDV